MGLNSAGVVWTVLAAAVLVPIAVAANSPLLAWRDPIYILAGFSGIVAMALLLVQPLMIGGYLRGFSARLRPFLHKCVGGILVMMIVTHVAALWLTSPPDVIDALLFRSPTPFSAWGVIAMWAVFASALLAAFRRKLRLKPRTWRIVHILLAGTIVSGSVVHAVLIEGTMGEGSKWVLCALVIVATLKVATNNWVGVKR